MQKLLLFKKKYVCVLLLFWRVYISLPHWRCGPPLQRPLLATAAVCQNQRWSELPEAVVYDQRRFWTCGSLKRTDWRLFWNRQMTTDRRQTTHPWRLRDGKAAAHRHGSSLVLPMPSFRSPAAWSSERLSGTTGWYEATIGYLTLVRSPSLHRTVC